MATTRTVDFLPPIFQTSTNRQFLAATLDQLVQEPEFKKTQGYVGRRVGPGVNPNDSYVIEPTAERANYQLEPGVVSLVPDTGIIADAITYPGINDALARQGALTDNSARLYTSDYYSWDPFISFDKFSNYSQYYWLPGGPPSVIVSATTIPTSGTFNVTRTDTAYEFSTIAGDNPALTLVRGGNYKFSVNQAPNQFWIQSEPGITGRLPYSPNISSRDVYGVANNGEDSGTVSFDVPDKNAQQFYYNLPLIDTVPTLGQVDLLTTTLQFDQVNNILLSVFLAQNPNGIDGITDLNGRTLVFTNTITDPQDGGWLITTQFDPLLEIPSQNGLPGSYDYLTYDQATPITNVDTRYSVWLIQYQYTTSGDVILNLTSRTQCPNLSKFTVIFGTEWSSTQWYRNAEGYFQQIPLLTAVQDLLWYQDGTNPDIFGQIRLVAQDNSEFINIDTDILGKKTYISPNGVVFTNNLKITFEGTVVPSSYQSQTYYVAGVGTAIQLLLVTDYVTPEIIRTASLPWDLVPWDTSNWDGTLNEPLDPDYITIALDSPDLNAWTRSNRWFHVDVINAAAAYNNSTAVLDNMFRAKRPIVEFRGGTRLYNMGTQALTPVNVIDLDQTDALSNINGTTGYYIDGYELQQGSRVIFALDSDPQVRNKVYVVDFISPATGPLPDSTLQAEPIINLVPADDAQALIDQCVLCLSGQTLQGVTFYYDGVQWIQAQQKTSINQTPMFDVYDLDGYSLGNSAVYPSSTFRITKNNLGTIIGGSALFSYALGTSGIADTVLGFPLRYLSLNNIGDIVFDNNLYVDTFIYTRDNVSTTENISKGYVKQYANRTVFQKEIGWQRAATKSQIYQQFSFTYAPVAITGFINDTTLTVTTAPADGSSLQIGQELRGNGVAAGTQITGLISGTGGTGTYLVSISQTVIPTAITATTPFILDVAVLPTGTIPSIKLYATSISQNYSSLFQDSATYTITTSDNNTVVRMNTNTKLVYGDIVEILALSDQVSEVGFYQVPINLENNPLNGNSPYLTLGTIRTHYDSIAQNLVNLTGSANGANNTRDLGNIIPYGLIILQQSSPLTLAGYFLREPDYNIFASLEYNSREYQKFKAQFLNQAGAGDYVNMTIPEILNAVFSEINIARNSSNPFYWSDMLPIGTVYTEQQTTVTPITTQVFDLNQVYNYTSANYQALLVYLSGAYTNGESRLLTRDVEYIVSTDAPIITILVPLTTGDVVTIQEYEATYGSYVPNTPTKLGLYPAYVPEIFLDTTYVTPTFVIRGHDGSITRAFNDFRDALLLEYETRIYNNLKLDGNPIPLAAVDVIPGQFRTTDYSLLEIQDILNQDFLSWVGWNKLDYKAQDYIKTNQFTWNYSTASNKLTDNQPLAVGAWRGLYNYFYDTIYPTTRPWEMLGFSEIPVWWINEYGPAPYTSGNLVLWGDLAAGLVRDPVANYIRPEYVRPGLLNVIPAGSEGALLSPMESVVGNFNSNDFQKSWVAGDDGSVENAWRTSSAYPFAIMRLLALTRPAEFFSLFADRDLYRFDTDYNQYLYNQRYRLDANGLEIYGNGTSKASYINWIVDFNRQRGINSTDALTADLKNLDVRLCYRMASFSAKNLLGLYTEQSSPNSSNSSLLLPDDSYNLLFYKNVPFGELTYSSVIVQVTETGWQIFGYNLSRPYFNILQSRVSGTLAEISAGGSTVRVPVEYTSNVVQIPYAYEFINRTLVVDFLLSYGALLQQQGMIFKNLENGYVLDWNQMASEFLYWSNQGWAPGSIINLNPNASQFLVEKPGAIVESIAAQTVENMILTANGTQYNARDLVIDRVDNLFSVTSLSRETINFLNIKFTSYESMIVLDNTSIFNDLIYNTVTGARQSRIRLLGWNTVGWNGQLNAPGFILNQDNIEPWNPLRKYSRGEIVEWKNTYYSAVDIVQPSGKFEITNWVVSDYTRIQQGLLPNAANKSNQLANSYNVYSANLELNQDLFSYALIGWKPRQYMVNLELDSTSQVQLYQQFLGTKGTVRAAEIFSFADLGRGTAQYDIYENWAILRGTYGANANRSFYELQLNEALLTANPSTIQVVETGESSEANQTVLVSNLWKSSYKITSPNILTTEIIPLSDTALPSAGYVNFEDVDITVFDLTIPVNLDINLTEIVLGATIWAAKINNYDWGIFRINTLPGYLRSVTANLDGTSVFTFNQPHGISTVDATTANLTFIVRYFADQVDGTYKILNAPSITQLVAVFSFANTNQVSESGNGIGFVLQTQRVSQASDTVNLPYANSLIPGNKVWVDNNGLGLWQVLEKQDVFTSAAEVKAQIPETDSLFGVSVAQSNNNLYAIVGSPGYDSEAGAAYTYIRTAVNPLQENSILELTGVPDVFLFGQAVSIGNQTWQVIGAPASYSDSGYAAVYYRRPGSNDFTNTALLTAPDTDLTLPAEFGYSVAMSRDEHWMYIGAPGVNKVFAYGLVEVQSQTVSYVTDGTTIIYNYVDSIVINPAYVGQLTVVLNNQLLTYGSDYTQTATNIVLNSPAPSQLGLTISRRTSASYVGDGSTNEFSLQDYLYTATNIYSVIVFVNGVTQRPNIDYEYIFDDSSYGYAISFFYAPAPNANIIATTNGYYTLTDTIEFTIPVTASISGSVMTVTNTSIGSPSLSIGMKLSGTGVSSIPETSITAFISGTGGIGTYTVYPSQSVASTTITARLPDTARFGHSVSCTVDGRQVMIGTPNDRYDSIADAGAVYVYDRSVQNFVITNSSQTSYTVAGGVLVDPTFVSLNNEFLVNTQDNIGGTFSVDGATVIVDTTLAVGDVLQIQPNTFNLLQIINANAPSNSAFGSAVDICRYSCSLYTGAPDDSSVLPYAGSVQRNVNQSRVYGVITSLNVNPRLQPGQSIRINDQEVIMSELTQWNINLAWTINTIVQFDLGVYRSIKAVPVGIAITDTAYWQQSTWVASLVNDINSSGIANIIASTGLPGTATFGLLTVSVKNILSAEEGNRLTVLPGLIGDMFQRLGYSTFVYTQTITSPLPVLNAEFGSALNIDSSALTLTVGAPAGNLYRPNTFDEGDTYFDGRTTTFSGPLYQSGAVYTYDYLSSVGDSVSNPGKFVFGQQIYDQRVRELDRFGTAVSYVNGLLLVGSPGSDLNDSTLSDMNYGRVAVFKNANLTPAWAVIREQVPVVDTALINSVYSYSARTGATTTYFDFIDPLQGKILGAAAQNLNYTGAVDPAAYNVGPVNNQGQSWLALHVGELWWDTSRVRFIDPNQDNITYASRRWGQVFPGSNINVYQWISSSVPPANYNGQGTPRNIISYSVVSGVNDSGMIETTYYFWVQGVTTIDTRAGKTLSALGVARYIADPRATGIPYVAFLTAGATAIYNAGSDISAQDTILSIEYDRELTDSNVHVQYSLIPPNRADGFLPDNLYLKFQDSLCGVNSTGAKVPDVTLSLANRYGVEFSPRQSMFEDRFLALKNYFGRANSVLAKFPITEIRSFALLNSQEPEPPEGTGEWNKRVANIEELSYQNFAQVPVGYLYLVASDSTQNGLWTIYEVTATKTFASLLLIRVQNYDTSKYWDYINWYLPDYDSSQQIITTVAVYSDLSTLSLYQAPVGSSVRVKANSQNKWEIYLRVATNTWERVGLQDGTIEISSLLWDYKAAGFGFDSQVFDSQYFDQEPVIETRRIIQAINQELLVDELLIERNRALILMFNFVLSEFLAPNWLTKTSLIDVDHTIRELLTFQTYRRDNQDFVVDYIQEIKPYHVQIRELNLIYNGLDDYQGTLTDFDVPAYYDTDIIPNQFVSPILTPYAVSTAVGTGTPSDASDADSTSLIWQNQPWNFWYQNYTLAVVGAIVSDAGSGYTVAPVATITGDCVTPAVITVNIDGSGFITGVTIVDPGVGYITTAIITLNGGNGTGGQLVAIMAGPGQGENTDPTSGPPVETQYYNLVRSFNLTMRYDRYQYASTIVDWEPNVNYDDGTLVRYDNRVWAADSLDSTGVESATFDPAQWQLVNAGTYSYPSNLNVATGLPVNTGLSGVDRTMGLYVPAVNEPGLDLSLLITGVTYPGVQVSAPTFSQNTGFDVGNFDINPFDNISYGPEGLPTYDPSILDTIYQSSFRDVYLGLRATDINVVGGEFVGPYESHAPEELVPGSEFDTLDFRVYTRPGSDWAGDGHGFSWKISKWIYNSTTAYTQSFSNLVLAPVQIRVTNQTQGRDLIQGVAYTVDWVNQTVEIIPGDAPPAANGNILVVSAFGIGGGNQLYKNIYNGADIANPLNIPVARVEIFELVIFVNGVLINDYTYAAGFNQTTNIVFGNTYTSTDEINVTAIGATSGSSTYTWSTPQTQYFVSYGQLDYMLDNPMSGTNIANLVVEINGIRARPPEGAMYIADGSSGYALPNRGGEGSLALVADNEVYVWVNNERLTLGSDYIVEPYTGNDTRYVDFAVAPAIGSEVLISVITKADYVIIDDGSSNNYTLVFRTEGGFYPITDDIVGVTSWNDTAQQSIVTLLWQGPVVDGVVVVVEPFDSTGFDVGTVTGEAGSFDYSDGVQVIENDFQLGRIITDPTRMWVTKNGVRIFYSDDYLIVGEQLIVHGPPISTTDVVVAQLYTDSVVPESMEFRIFQDMRGVQATYRMTPSTTTTLAQTLLKDQDIIYVNDAGALTEPNLAINVWGIITINGERIMYRELDTANNTVSSLMRGTAGTAVAEHAVDSIVYNIGQGNLAPVEYQDRVVYTNTLGDGSTTTFSAPNIDLSQLSTSFAEQAILVYVAGLRVYTGYAVDSIAPATITFNAAPTAGYEVSIRVRQGLGWYYPGDGSTDGQALQVTQTDAARFFRGQN